MRTITILLLLCMQGFGLYSQVPFRVYPRNNQVWKSVDWDSTGLGANYERVMLHFDDYQFQTDYHLLDSLIIDYGINWNQHNNYYYAGYCDTLGKQKIWWSGYKLFNHEIFEPIPFNNALHSLQQNVIGYQGLLGTNLPGYGVNTILPMPGAEDTKSIVFYMNVFNASTDGFRPYEIWGVPLKMRYNYNTFGSFVIDHEANNGIGSMIASDTLVLVDDQIGNSNIHPFRHANGRD
jgi:hypothetical protein